MSQISEACEKALGKSNKELFLDAGTDQGCETNIIDYLLSVVDKVSSDIVQVVYTNLVFNNVDVIVLFTSVAVAVYGWRIMTGRSEDDLTGGMMQFGKIALVLTLLFNYQAFYQWFYEFFTHTPNELMAKGMKNSGYSVLNTQNPNSTIGVFIDKGWALSGMAWELGGLGYVYSVIVFLGTLIVTGLGVGLICLAKVFTALLLMLAPVFLTMWLFSSTRGIFQGWLQNLFTMFLLTILVYGLMLLVFAIMQYPYVDMSYVLQENERNVNLGDFTALFILGGISYYLFKQVMGMAASMASGFVMQQLAPVRNLANSTMGSAAKQWSSKKLIERFNKKPKAG